MMGGSVQIIRGNALDLPLADNSVDLVVTSPPYFGLRSYRDGGEHYDGQIGAEATPAEFVDALIAATREMMRVVKPSGSIWVNLGDKYASGGRGSYDLDPGRREVAASRPADGARPKSLLGIPWRYAIRCIDELGLILRAEVIWSKPNGLPESVKDRVRRSHEQWFHFTLNPRYYSAVDEVREPHTGEFLSSGVRNPRYGRPGGMMPGVAAGVHPGKKQNAGETDGRAWSSADNGNNPLGKLPGSVWTIPTEPLRVPKELGIDHFAAFPTEWPRRIITGWSPRGVCVECGEGRRPVVDKGGLTASALSLIESRNAKDNYIANARGNGDKSIREHQKLSGTERARLTDPATITGESCDCPEPTAPTTPGVVLDPFGGTGTTALVASVLGRHGISNDMSADYCRLAEWRTSDPKQQAKAARRKYKKPPAKQEPGQAGLF